MICSVSLYLYYVLLYFIILLCSCLFFCRLLCGRGDVWCCVVCAYCACVVVCCVLFGCVVLRRVVLGVGGVLCRGALCFVVHMCVFCCVMLLVCVMCYCVLLCVVVRYCVLLCDVVL